MHCRARRASPEQVGGPVLEKAVARNGTGSRAAGQGDEGAERCPDRVGLLPCCGLTVKADGPQRKGCCRRRGMGSIPLRLLKFGPDPGSTCGTRGRLVVRRTALPRVTLAAGWAAAEQLSPARLHGWAGSLACPPASPSVSCVAGAQTWTVRHPATSTTILSPSREKGLWCFKESLPILQSRH